MKSLKTTLLLSIMFLTCQFSIAQQDQPITLIVSGTGMSKEHAVKNALRSSIEQAFGTFISTKTEILNDNLVKDEIVSISNGNIVGYEIISEVTLPDGSITTSVKSTVSISKLTSYCESKGIQIEFKGSLFATNIKLQKLNEEAEAKAITNLCEISDQILSNSLDFSIRTSEPIQVSGSSDLFQIRYLVECKTNNNYKNFNDLFLQTIGQIAMSAEEVNKYKSLNKPIYSFECRFNLREKDKNSKYYQFNNSIDYDKQIISLRSGTSAIALQNFFIKLNDKLLNFVIKNGLEEITVNKAYCQSNCFEKNLIKMISDGGRNQIDRWFLNCGNESFNPIAYSMIGNRNSGLVDFAFSTNMSQQYKSNYDYYSRYLYSKFQNNFFNKDKRYSTTMKDADYYSNPYTSILFYPSNSISGTFGILKLQESAIFLHAIDKQYTLQQMENISYVKIEPLK